MNVLKYRQIILTVFLAGMAIFNGLKWTYQFSQAPYKPLDFRTYYSGAQTYFNHLNPYDKNDLTLNWMRSANPSFESPKYGVHETVVYAPQFVWFFWPYQVFDYDSVKWIQLFINILSLLISIWLISKIRTDIPIHLILLAFCAFKGTWFALSNGQPMIQILLIILTAFYLLFVKNYKYLPGILIGICGFKFTFLIPIAIFLLQQKKYKTFTMISFTVLILNITAIATSGSPALMLQSWKHNLSTLYNYNHAFSEFNGLNIINCSSSVVLRYFLDIPTTKIHLIYTSLLLASSFYCLWILRRQYEFRLLFVLSLVSFCFGQHLIYDILFLMTYWILQYDNKKEPLSAWLLVLTLCLPLSIMASKIPFIHFVLPIVLLIYTSEAIYSDYRLRRNKDTKNAS